MQTKKGMALFLILLLLVLPFGAFITQSVLPDQESSQLEATTRLKNPLKQLSWQTYRDGSLSADLETYVAQQMPFREFCIQLNSDLATLTGRIEHKNTVRMKNGCYLVFGAADGNIEAYTAQTVDLAAALEKIGLPLSVVIGASKECVLSDDVLPPGYVNNGATRQEDEAFANLLTQAGLHAYTLYEDIERVAAEGVYPYYLTDHHWNERGAFAGYTHIANDYYAQGVTDSPAVSREDMTLYTDPHRFYGSKLREYGGSLFLAPVDTVRQYLPSDGQYRVSSADTPAGFATVTGGAEVLIEPHRFDDIGNPAYADYYSVSLAGSGNRLLTNLSRPDAPTLLVLGDSYITAVLPMLIQHFGKIYYYDVRYYEGSITELAQSLDADAVCFHLMRVSGEHFANLKP